MHVAACYIYPLKSGQAVAVPGFEITARGPKNDRLWMVVRDGGDKDGHFLTQRERGCAKMALIQPHLNADNILELNAPQMPALRAEDVVLSEKTRDVKIWEDTCKAFDAGDRAAQWLSNYLGQPVRLVRIDDSQPRPTDPKYSTSGDEVGFADGYPLLVTAQSSLEKLSEHFPSGSNIGMERFRPNIVLAGTPPFAEDIIHEMKVGDIVLELVKPCERCPITTIDQASGISPNSEPLKTLGKVRRGSADGLKGAFFGHNAIPRSLGTIAVGSPVEILSQKTPHPAVAQALLKPSI